MGRSYLKVITLLYRWSSQVPLLCPIIPCPFAQLINCWIQGKEFRGIQTSPLLCPLPLLSMDINSPRMCLEGCLVQETLFLAFHQILKEQTQKAIQVNQLNVSALHACTVLVDFQGPEFKSPLSPLFSRVTDIQQDAPRKYLLCSRKFTNTKRLSTIFYCTVFVLYSIWYPIL